MTTPEPDLAHLPDQWMDERGVTLTRAGVQRVRRRLAEADQAKTSAERAAERQRFLDHVDAA